MSARSDEPADDQVSPGTEEAQPDIASGAVKRRPTQPNQSPVQYPGSSPFQSTWPLNGRSASLQHEHSPHIGISPRGGSEAMNHGNQQSPQMNNEDRHRSNSSLANSMMRTVVASGNDALNILFEAATAQNDEEHAYHEPSPSMGGNSKPEQTGSNDRQPLRNYRSPIHVETVRHLVCPVELAEATQDTLEVWQACRFVRMGWFTAREAVTFIDL